MVIPVGTLAVLYKRSEVAYGYLDGMAEPAVGLRTGKPVLL